MDIDAAALASTGYDGVSGGDYEWWCAVGRGVYSVGLTVAEDV